MSYKFIVYKDAKGEWRWSLKAPNGRIVADSGEGYTRRESCVNAIRKLKKNICNSIEEVE